MPTYEYRCKACGHELEVVQSFTDDALTTCDECGGALRKVFGNVGIAFKGTGFYKNDSRGKPATATPSADKVAATGNGDKTSSDAGSGSAKEGGASPKKDAPADKSSSAKADGAKSPSKRPSKTGSPSS